MTAPIASGWSKSPGGLAPTGKRRLFTAHADSGHSTTTVEALYSGLGERLRLPQRTPPTERAGYAATSRIHAAAVMKLPGVVTLLSIDQGGARAELGSALGDR